MALPAHSKIVNKVARELLKPLGLKQKGQSRIWIDDNSWWLISVEYTPSRWSAGTGLLVGVNWLWCPVDVLGFRMSHDEKHIEFKCEEEFIKNSYEYTKKAIDKIVEFRSHLKTPQTAQEYLLKNELDSDEDIWSCLNKALICVLTNHKESDYLLEKVVNCSEDRVWAIPVKDFASELLKVDNCKRFAKITDIINNNRIKNKLKNVEFEFW